MAPDCDRCGKPATWYGCYWPLAPSYICDDCHQAWKAVNALRYLAAWLNGYY